MKKLIFIVVLLSLFGCSQNYKIIKDKVYSNSNFWGAERITFLNDNHFHYFSISDDEEKTVGNGTYLFSNDSLYLIFDITPKDQALNHYKIDSILSDRDSVDFDINFKYGESDFAIKEGIISVFNTKNVNIKTYTCDENGHINLKFKKSNKNLLLKTSYSQKNQSNNYYRTSFNLVPNMNYNITIHTIGHYGENYYDGETIGYKIISIVDESMELLSPWGRKAKFKIWERKK